MLRPLLTILLALLSAGPLPAQTEAAIQGFIDDAIKSGSGDVVIPPGTYVIQRGLRFQDARNLRFSGLDRERTVLKLAPIAFARTSGVSPAGSTELPVSQMQHLLPGMKLSLECDGETDSFTKKPKPYQLARLKSIVDGRLVLEAPVKFAVPSGTQVLHADAPNLIEVRGASENVLIENLTLDGGRTEDGPPVRGHARLCGVFVSGVYDYEKGPAFLVKGVAVSRCIIQNCYGRGVAYYAVEGGIVEGCTIMDTNDEAIDFDHFTIKSAARHNHVARSLVGIELNDASDCLITGNDFRHCATGLNLWRWCRQPGLNEGHRILGNLFAGATGNAMQIGRDTANNLIEGNEVDGAGRHGISLGGKGHQLKDNRFRGVGLKDVVELGP